MFIYNVTIKVSTPITDAWLKWLKTEHVPEMVATGCFTHAVITRLLEIDEEEGPTYAVQYYAESKAFYNKYIEQFAADMRQKGLDKWGNQFIAFRSLMEIVN